MYSYIHIFTHTYTVIICTDKRTSRFCRASVSHVVRLYYYYLKSWIRSKGGLYWLQKRAKGETVRQHFCRKCRNISDRKTAADWVRSVVVCCCFPRPSPARPTVGGRTPLTKRAPSVLFFGSLPAGWLASQETGAWLFLSYRYYFLKTEVEGDCGGNSRLLLSVHRARFDFTGTSIDSTAISPRKVKLDMMKGWISG